MLKAAGKSAHGSLGGFKGDNAILKMAKVLDKLPRLTTIEGLVAQVVEQVLSANEKSVADYRSGKEKAFGFLVGQVMRQLRGQAAPAVVRQVLLEQLAEQ